MQNNKQWIPMPRFLLRKDAIKQLLKKTNIKNNQVLEIGFGAGEMLKWFNSKGAICSGVDFSESAMDLAQERLAKARLSDDIKLFPNFKEVQQETFDIVCAFEVLEHIQEDTAAISEWLTYLKPNGSLLISVPAHMSKWCRNDEWAGHIKRYEKKEFETIFKPFNVEVKSVWNYGYPFILVLDKLLNKSRRDATKDNLTLTAKTKSSGVDRPNKKLYQILSKDWFLFPAYLSQRMFFNLDLGSGYLVHVKKAKK